MSQPTPPVIGTIDIKEAANEIKKYIDAVKMDNIDHNAFKIEIYPDPADPELPVLLAFAQTWRDFFNYADQLVGEDGKTGFPEEMAQELEDTLEKIQDEVNKDKKYWSSLREVVMPLYEDMRTDKIKEGWENRWKKVKLWYDPCGLDVKTSKLMRGQDSGKVYERTVISERTIPEGFVIEIL